MLCRCALPVLLLQVKKEVPVEKVVEKVVEVSMWPAATAAAAAAGQYWQALCLRMT
jgi:hypothetical protein